MPESWHEFTGRELVAALGVSANGAEQMLDLAWILEVNLPGTKAAFRAGILSRDKAAIIAVATAVLDPAEARAAEAMVLDRAGSLTPPALRAAIDRAVMDVNPGKARKRREHAAKRARVERWCEPSGNAGLAGRELPPAQVLAADQRITWWAEQLRKAGLDGGMDALRARALMDILLGVDSRPPASDPGSAREPHAPVPAGPLAGVIPPGFAGRANLTIPVVTLLDLADRPGELAGIGPIDPDLARDLAAAAARSSRSTWCVTVTDSQGHATGHACARPAPASPAKRTTRHARRARPAEQPPVHPHPHRPARPARRLRDVEVFHRDPRPTGPAPRDRADPTGECDHRHQARATTPASCSAIWPRSGTLRAPVPAAAVRPAYCDFEHDAPYETGGRTCLCNGNPKCRHDHRLKQDSRWQVEQLENGNVRWTTPSALQYVTEPTRYPI